MADARPRPLPCAARVRHRRDFQAIFATRRACAVGPLVVHAGDNALGHCRIGLAVGRKVGHAPRRNRIKRLLREAFRHVQHDLPSHLDLVVVVSPHEPLTWAAYAQLLVSAATQLTGAGRA